MKFIENTKLKNVYSKVLENADIPEDEFVNDDDDFDIGELSDILDKHSSKLYLTGNVSNFKVPKSLQKEIYKVDLSLVTPGQLTDKSLAKAFKTVLTHTPPTWQYAIQFELNTPTALKIGRNTVIKNFPAYLFSYETALQNSLLPPLLVMACDDLKSRFNFVLQKVFIKLSYIPKDPSLKWSDPTTELVKGIPGSSAQYDYIVTGETSDSKPFALGYYPIRMDRKMVLYGPVQSMDYEKITKNGIIVRVLEWLVKKYPKNSKIAILLDDVNRNGADYARYEKRAPAQVKKLVADTLQKNMAKAGF